MTYVSQDFIDFVVSTVGAYVAWGVGLSIVFWTLGYVVWFIVQMFK